jgi:hypothetical protein
LCAAPRSLDLLLESNFTINSGAILTVPITVAVKDFYGQTVLTDNSTIVEVRATNASISGVCVFFSFFLLCSVI